ncbi:site-specific integrase [Hyphobacterium sp. HN65]|uniref:Site-specific integrase n=1 Tax=Hyphobacterium lacteum TaxID=3116575 RepID=A0ABU7LTH3_9PROT|nr:site-specific integrase [Hyphobacterium sp. HN65]MEE2527196.1 site-specific integrase [Hyphobacterium sp. HN65]
MAGHITKRIVDAAKPGETLWDGDLPGFGLRVTAKGVKSYVLKYRARGQQRWLTIGQHGKPMPADVEAVGASTWTPSAARNEAMRLLGRVRDGADPAGENQTARKAETLAQFAKRYEREHIEAHLKKRTIEDAKRNLKKHILPALGKLKVRDITRDDVARFHRSMRETPYAANRCLALISHMLSSAERWGVSPNGSTVCRHITKYKEKQRKRYLSADELKGLGVALGEADAKGMNPQGLAIIRLLIFTGARRLEISALRWDEVDFERGAIHLRDSKAGQKSVPLGPPALAILNKLERVEGSPWVFPAISGDSHYQGLGKLWREIRKMAKLDDVRLHDLRHTFASFGAAGGQSLPIIGALLGHKQSATTQRYAHLSNDPLQLAATRISMEIDAAISGRAPADIAPIPSK